MKIAINTEYGGFSVSKAVYKELGFKWDGYGYLDNEDFGIKSDKLDAWRADPRLIAAIEKLGVNKASGDMAQIAIRDIPDGTDWEINDYDGMESIHEAHSIW